MSARIHFVDLARTGSELRPICGAWGEDVTWTTLACAVTCSACARLRRRRAAGAAAREREATVVDPLLPR